MKVARFCLLIVVLVMYYGLFRVLFSSTNIDQVVFTLGLMAGLTGVVAWFVHDIKRNRY